jgi:hypothetical protein
MLRNQPGNLPGKPTREPRPVGLRPFFSYYGGKWKTALYYPSPEHNIIIEPFAGSAGYSLRHPEKRVILCDCNESIAQVWHYLLRVSEAEILSLPDMPLDGSTVESLPVCEEARTLIGFWLNRANQSPCRRPSAWMRKGVWPDRFWGPATRQRISSQLEYIRHWKFLHTSYENLPNLRATWFIDPPYSGVEGKAYKSTPLDYLSLSEWCRSRPGLAIVCESDRATWLPFQVSHGTQGTRYGSLEAVYIQRSQA